MRLTIDIIQLIYFNSACPSSTMIVLRVQTTTGTREEPENCCTHVPAAVGYG